MAAKTLADAMNVDLNLGRISQDVREISRNYNEQRLPLVKNLREKVPGIQMPSTKDPRILPVSRVLERTKKEILMVVRRLFSELERVEAQLMLTKQEKGYLTEQLQSTKDFRHKMAQATKLRETVLRPDSVMPSSLVRDAVQKQLLSQKQEMNKSTEGYGDIMIGIDISIKQLDETRVKLEAAVKAKEAALFTDTVALSQNIAAESAPPNQKHLAVRMPRTSWLLYAEELMQEAAFVFKNATRKQVQSAALRRSRGMMDENFRLKLIEMLHRGMSKSGLARPYIEAKLRRAEAEIDTAERTLEHLTGVVEDKKEPIGITTMQEVMRNQRPFSESVDDSAARAIDAEKKRWVMTQIREQGALDDVHADLKGLYQVKSELETLLGLGDDGVEMDSHVLSELGTGSPIPAALMDTVSPKKSNKARAGKFPSAHHIGSSSKLAPHALGQRAVSVLEERLAGQPHHNTMPRLQKHVTMTSNLTEDPLASGFWSPPKREQIGLSPNLGKPPLALKPLRAQSTEPSLASGAPKAPVQEEQPAS